VKYFYDTEFLELGPGHPIYLLSIGIVAEDGSEMYLQNLDCPTHLASDWVVENVFPHLQDFTPTERSGGIRRPDANAKVWQRREAIANQVARFINSGEGKPEFWGYYADYDHVALCQLFGTMMDLPKGWPMYTRDIKQLCVSLGNPKLPEQGKGEHHALADARWNKVAYEFLMSR
jgi:3' exoribonuclease, RNase T-like